VLFVYLYIIAMYIRPQDWVPGLVGFPTAFVIIPLGFIAGLLQYQKNPQLYKTPHNYLLPVYLLIIFISTLINVDMSVAVYWTIEFLKRILLFFMIVLNVNTTQKIKNVLAFVLLVTVFLGYQAFLQATQGQSWGGLSTFPGYDVIRIRWYGDWDGPNVLAILFLISSAISLEYILGKHSLITRLINLGLIAVNFMAIYYTNSRGAVLAFVCGLIFFYHKRLMSRYTPIMLGLLGLVFVLAPSRMTEVSSEEQSAGERTWLWEQGLGMLHENPIFGVGRGMFASNTDLKLIAHNNYVQNFAELGYAGFFVFISLLWFTFKGTYMVAETLPTSHSLKSYARMCSVILVMYGAATFFVVMELDLFYFVLGLATCVYLIARRESDAIPPFRYTFLDLKFVVAGMIVIQVAVWLAAIKHIL